MRRFVKMAVPSLILLLLAGFIYERIGRSRDAERFPRIGRAVDIAGRSMNINCQGTGSPTVVFDSGGSGIGIEWEPVQVEVAKRTQACWYDRAGNGWSDPGPYPRTSAAMARELHELLQRAGLRPPFVFVGASFGGLNARVYTGLFPSEVSGLVLVDSAHELEPERAPKFYLGRAAPRYLWYPLYLAFEFSANFGLARLTSGGARAIHTRDDLIRALRQQPKAMVNQTAGMQLPESYAQAKAAGNFGDRPLIVLTAGKPPEFDDPAMSKQADAYQKVWIHEIQAGLAKLSTQGKQIVLGNHTHGSMDPGVTVSAILDVISRTSVTK